MLNLPVHKHKVRYHTQDLLEMGTYMEIYNVEHCKTENIHPLRNEPALNFAVSFLVCGHFTYIPSSNRKPNHTS